MKTATELHRAAMATADEAYDARRKGDRALSHVLFTTAFEQERAAAEALVADVDREPTRSILLRSAATLALKATLHREAERLIAIGLSGNPPDDIADELRDLLEQVYFERHLELRGIELQPSEFQLSLAGNSVGHGVSDSHEFISRVDLIQKLVYRTAERRRGQSYRDKGKPRDEFARDLELFVSVPRAASFAVSLRIGAPEQMLLPGSPRQSLVSEVVDELLECLALFEESDVTALRKRIPDNAYYRNFVALAKSLAPDGDNVKIVGFTSSGADEKPRKLALTRPRAVAPRVDPKKRDESSRVVVEGILMFADSTHIHPRIQLVDDQGVKHRIVVPDGMMADIVKPMWESRVRVSGRKKLGVIVLEDIVPG